MKLLQKGFTKLFFLWTRGFPLALTVVREQVAMTPGLAFLVARRLRAKIINWKEDFFYFKLKKGTRRKRIVSINNYKSQLYHRKKYEYSLFFFIFKWFFLKTKTFQAHFCKYKHFLLLFSLWKLAFFQYSSLCKVRV